MRQAGKALLALAASLAFAIEAPGSAAECAESAGDWVVIRGSLRALARCGAYLAFTDGAPGTFSYADFLYQKPVRAPLDAAVSWRRLGPETGRSLELRALGALVLVRDGEYGLYVWNEATFAWRPLPGYREQDEHRVAIHQTPTTLSFSVDGRTVDSWPLVATAEGRVGFAFKGASGYRSAVAIRDFRVATQ